MIKFNVHPILVVSKCLEFDHCRWDGQIITSNFVRALIPYVEFIPVCPEVEIGLGIPRKPVRLILRNGEIRLFQPSTERDLTEQMVKFIDSFLGTLPEVDGFILKNRSPTSGIKEARIFHMDNGRIIAKSSGPGLFGRTVLHRFPYLAIEDEGRLRNATIKQHFLVKIFTLARFRQVKNISTYEALSTFNNSNELLFHSYSSRTATKLDICIGNKSAKIADMLSEYESLLFNLLKRPPSCGANIKTINKVIDRLSNKLSLNEKEFLRAEINKYRSKSIPFSVILGITKSWIARFADTYLENQTFFNPYPEGLADLDTATASCDSKNYWS
jgi:uncharacterized protein YbbK (DUF523 family)